MSIHPNAPPRPSVDQIDDPEELLASILQADPRPRRKDAETRVLSQFPWWNRWKPGWRPPDFPSSKSRRSPQQENARKSSYQARREEVYRERQRRKRQREEEAQAKQRSSKGSGAGDESIAALFDEGDKAIADWTLLADASSYDDLLVEDHHTADDVVQILFTALSRMREERDQAISLISILAAERTRLRAHVTAQSRPAGQTGSLYRKVGLDERCPDFLLRAARLAYRKQFHPDAHSESQRPEAERRFKESEAAFYEIMRLRSS